MCLVGASLFLCLIGGLLRGGMGPLLCPMSELFHKSAKLCSCHKSDPKFKLRIHLLGFCTKLAPRERERDQYIYIYIERERERERAIDIYNMRIQRIRIQIPASGNENAYLDFQTPDV